MLKMIVAYQDTRNSRFLIVAQRRHFIFSNGNIVILDSLAFLGCPTWEEPYQDFVVWREVLLDHTGCNAGSHPQHLHAQNPGQSQKDQFSSLLFAEVTSPRASLFVKREVRILIQPVRQTTHLSHFLFHAIVD